MFIWSFLCVAVHAQQQGKPEEKRVNKKNLQLSNIHLQSGVDRFNGREYFTAIEEFKTALKYNPNLWLAYRFMGDAERQLGKFTDAVTNYNNALLFKEDTASYFGRAEARRMNREFDLALTDYNKALVISPKNYTFHLGKGECLIELDRFEEAVEEFTLCIRHQPYSRPGYSKRGFSYFSLKKYFEAIIDFNNYFRLNGREVAAYYYRGSSYLSLSFSNIVYADSAIADYKIMENLDNGGNSYDGLGAAYGIKGDSSIARKYFRMAVKIDPENSETYYLWGRSELNFGEYKKALDLFNRQALLVKVMDSNLYFSFAMANLGLCKLDVSLEYFAKAIELDSLKSEYYLSRIGALFRSQKTNENLITRRDLTKVIKLSDDRKLRSMLLVSRGFIELRLGNSTEARNDIDSAMVVSLPGAIHYMFRGIVKSNNQETSTSIVSDFDLAIEQDSSMWQPWLMKSYFYRGQKDKKQSCNSLKKAIDLGASVDEETKHYLCSGKRDLQIEGMALNSILSDLLVKSILSKGSLTIDCDNVR